MELEMANEIFVAWLASRMTKAGRGDLESTLSVEPSGKYWLGRLQSAEAVADSDWGDRGERLEPCAFGIKIKPAHNGPWQFQVITTFSVWLWEPKEKVWHKSNPIIMNKELNIKPVVGIHQYFENEYIQKLNSAFGNEGLAARIDIEVDKGKFDDFELRITLVNSSTKKSPHYKDTRFYQSELAIKNLETTPFMLESLEDSFCYDRRVDAYGINCGVVRHKDGSYVTEDAITADRMRPHYWSVEDKMPTMQFVDLASDPIQPIMELILALKRWGKDNWSKSALDIRAINEDWSVEMRTKASKTGTQFEEECARLELGLDLLKSNEKLLSAFKGMNTALLLSTNGKYESWRPFQLGFLVANLQSIINSQSETETVDVVWFATGGGKTETYLGLLITAALYDRMTGKVSGVTAWSRFPLRMLSLQQTQRFANAIAAAEMVRQKLQITGDPFSLGFFVGQGATPNRITGDPGPGDPDPDDQLMPSRYQILEFCPFCHQKTISMSFDRRLWKLEHHCTNTSCDSYGNPLPLYIIDEEIYRFLPTVIVGTLDKAASISIQASMRGLVGAPLGLCSREGHGYTYSPRSARPTGCLVPGCKGEAEGLPMEADRYGPSFRLQDELHLLRDSLGAVDSHYEALYDSLQEELCGRKPKILASSATLTGYEKQVAVLYRRTSRVFPVPSPRSGGGFWTSESTGLMRRFVAIAPRGVTIEYTVDRLLTELQIAIRQLTTEPDKTCAVIGIPTTMAREIISFYGTNVVYGNTLRDLEAVMRSLETQVIVQGQVNTASLTGKTDFNEVRNILDRLQSPEQSFDERLHIISASSMMSHGVDMDRLNIMVMLGIPLSAAEFIQATARVGRRHPGLVFVIHKIGRERDAGIYRAFPQFISQGDRFIEPIPVTKRSRRVLDKTISGLMLARLLMIHEPKSGTPLTTVKAFKNYVAQGKLNLDLELKAIIETLELDSALDEPLKKDLINWFNELSQNIVIPPNDARFPSDLSPSGPPMLSLRDVEKQIPINGSRV